MSIYIVRIIKKEKGEKMKIIEKCDCGEFTNGESCKAKNIEGTKSYEKCEFAGCICTKWKEECKNKSIKEKITFLQNKIMDIGFFRMENCKKRIEKKWKNHHANEEKIRKIRQKVKVAIDNINSEIKLLKKNARKEMSKNIT